MKKLRLPIALLILQILIACGDKEPDKVVSTKPLLIGMDLSFQPEIASSDFVFKDENSRTIEMLPFLKAKGVDIVRLRLWHTPADGHSGLNELLEYSQDVKSAGMEILLDIHYSDWWADPGSQTIPVAWQGLTAEQLKTEIYDYTLMVMEAMEAQNTLPSMVQIGNETNSGFLWDLGRVGGSFDSNWNTYIEMIGEGMDAVREVNPTTKIMLHYAGLEGSDWFFNNVSTVDYDIIGLSYYPIWHGKSLTNLQTVLNNLSSTHGKEIMIVETAYPYSMNWADWTNNIWGSEDQLISGYTATPEGQAAFFAKLKEIMINVPNKKGLGICYWAPDWVAFKGTEATDGSTWENATTFDFSGRALPIMDEFEDQ